jgi:tRNA uridine 5-carboxymethylaminomethyl modification enzyme
LGQVGLELSKFSPEALEQLEIQTKYAGYIERDLELLEGVRKAENLKIPEDLNLEAIAGLSNEIRSKLKVTRPETIGQASRIQGITPAAVANLVLHLRMRRKGGSPQISV